MARTWEMPAEPTDNRPVWDVDGDRWEPSEEHAAWVMPASPGVTALSWGELLAEHGPLTDEEPKDVWEAFGKAVDTVVVAALQEQDQAPRGGAA